MGLQDHANDARHISESVEDISTSLTNTLKSDILPLQDHANDSRDISESLEDSAINLINNVTNILKS